MANKRLNATISIGGAVASSLRSAFGNIKGQVGQVGSALRRLENEQRMVTSAIRTFGEMGKNVDKLRGRYIAITAQVDKLKAAYQQLNDIKSAQDANDAQRAEIMGKIFETAAFGAVTLTPIVQAAAFEKAMLGVAKQVEGARDDNGNLTKTYYDMGAAIQQLGREIPIATNDLAEMVAAGARMGVAKSALLDFTRSAAMMSSAFELPAGKLAEDMGKIAGLYKIPVTSINSLADSINYLDDNAQSKGGDIIEYLTRVGGSASSVKITGQSMAALGSTLLTLGESTETAGTATNAMFAKFAAAEKGTKKFKEAMKEIGLSTSSVQSGMAKDAEGTLLKIIDQIGKLPESKRSGVMVELVGLEHQDTLAKLVANVTEYRKQIALAGSDKAKGSMSREFSATMQTTTAQFETLKNSVVETSVNIGSTLLPTVNALMGAFAKGSGNIADFAREHPALTRVVIGATTAIVGLRLATLGGALAFTYMKGAALAVAKVLAGTRAQIALTAISTRLLGSATLAANGGLLGMATRALPAVTLGLRAMTAASLAFLMTPIGAAVGAVVAVLAVGAVWVYKNWGKVAAFFEGFGEGFMQSMAPLSEAISNMRNSLGPLKPIFDGIGAAVGTVWDWFKKLLDPVVETPESLAKATDAGLNFGRVVGGAINFVLTPMRKLIEGITWIGNNAGAILDKVGGAIAKAKSFVGLGDDPAATDAQPDVAGLPGAVTIKGAADAANPPLPMIPPMAGAKSKGGGYVDKSETKIYVQQQPGQDNRDLAREITKEQERQRGIRQRGAMTDGASAQ